MCCVCVLFVVVAQARRGASSSAPSAAASGCATTTPSRGSTPLRRTASGRDSVRATTGTEGASERGYLSIYLSICGLTSHLTHILTQHQHTLSSHFLQVPSPLSSHGYPLTDFDTDFDFDDTDLTLMTLTLVGGVCVCVCVSHRYGSICGFHHAEGHGGPWKECKKCEAFFHPFDYAVKVRG